MTYLSAVMGSVLDSFFSTDRQSLQTPSYLSITPESYRGMIPSLYDKYKHFPLVEMQFSVWEDFKNYHGKVEYYLFGGGLRHGGVCFRIPNQDAVVVQAELVLGRPRGTEIKWFVLCRKGKWKPKKEDEIHISTHDWHSGTVLKVAHDFAKNFKTYHALFNNCNDWKHKVVEYMRKEGPPNVQRPNCLEELLHLAKKLGTHLNVMQEEIGEVEEVNE